MTYFPLTKGQEEWRDRAADIAAKELAPGQKKPTGWDAIPKNHSMP